MHCDLDEFELCQGGKCPALPACLPARPLLTGLVHKRPTYKQKQNTTVCVQEYSYLKIICIYIYPIQDQDQRASKQTAMSRHAPRSQESQTPMTTPPRSQTGRGGHKLTNEHPNIFNGRFRNLNF
jgi:hypothetical protein